MIWWLVVEILSLTIQNDQQPVLTSPNTTVEKNKGSDINILKNKIDSGGTKEESENDIADDLNEMDYFDEAQLDEDQ